MKRKSIMLCTLIMALAILVTACGAPKYDVPVETVAPVETPAPLDAQPEINDAGTPFAYKVSGTITDNMVIQRNQYVNVFGFSDSKGSVVYADFMGQTRYAVVDENGEWMIQFDAQKASTDPVELKVYNKNEGSGNGRNFTNLLIGDVWIVAGQSNAQISLSGTLDNNPEFMNTVTGKENIRLFTQWFWDYPEFWIEQSKLGTDAEYEMKDIPAASTNAWQQATPELAKNFSAIGYYFAKMVSDNSDVPIGLVQAVAGGASISHFMPSQFYDKALHHHGQDAPDMAAGEGNEYQIAFDPCNVYDCLLRPFANTRVAGFIWYQGEANEADYDTYADDLTDFVSMMRKLYGDSMPFYNVQLTSHNDPNQTWDDIANLRCAQTDALEKIDNYYVVCSMDFGSNGLDTDWAHPKNKKHIGDRLAYIALSKIYAPDKFKIEDYGSPVPAKVEVNEDDNCAYIYFKYVGEGLKTVDGGKKVTGFYSKQASSEFEAEIVDKNCVKVKLLDRNGNSISGIEYKLIYGWDTKTNGLMADQSSCNLQNSKGIGACSFAYRHYLNK